MSDSPDTPEAEIDLPEKDPEIAALLNFEPAPRQTRPKVGWTPALQRKFIAHLARTGSPHLAAEALGKNRHGVEKVYKSKGADGFRAAWDAAVALFEQRAADGIEREHASFSKPPYFDRRKKQGSREAGPLPGQILNERDEWEDEESVRRRVEEARDNITRKLLRARRLYLEEICDSPGKRAAFEILTEIPVDWERAAELKAQPDEPYNVCNMRQPDMLLTAENGWMGDMVRAGRNKKAELQRAIDEHRAAEGLPPVDWNADEESDENE